MVILVFPAGLPELTFNNFTAEHIRNIPDVVFSRMSEISLKVRIKNTTYGCFVVGVSDWVIECVGEWVIEWVIQRASERTSEWVFDWAFDSVSNWVSNLLNSKVDQIRGMWSGTCTLDEAR